jgi:hypothetical protein
MRLIVFDVWACHKLRTRRKIKIGDSGYNCMAIEGSELRKLGRCFGGG